MSETSLAGAFAPPSNADRAAGLRGLGTARRADAPATISAPVPPVAVAAPAPTAPAAAPPAGDTATVYLDPRVHRRLSQYCRSQRRGKGRPPSFTSVVFDAVEQLHPRLAEVFGPARDPAPQGALFARRAPQRRHLPGPQVQVTLEPGAANVEVLDGLAHAHGQSRSGFVNTVLEEFLPGGRRPVRD